MIKSIVKAFFKIAMLLSVVYLAITAIQRLTGTQADYVEIYNDDLEEEFY